MKQSENQKVELHDHAWGSVRGVANRFENISSNSVTFVALCVCVCVCVCVCARARVYTLKYRNMNLSALRHSVVSIYNSQ
jgi:hypothetical protein